MHARRHERHPSHARAAHHHAAVASDDHHAVLPTYGGRYHDSFNYPETPQSRLVATRNQLLLSTPNQFSGQRTLHRVLPGTRPYIVLHEENGLSAEGMLSSRLLQSIAYSLAPNGLAILTAQGLRLDNDGHFRDNRAQLAIGGEHSNIHSYLDQFGLELAPHIDVPHDLAESAGLHEQGQYSLVLKHNERTRDSYPRDENGAVQHSDRESHSGPVSAVALDFANSGALNTRDPAHATPNEEHHALGAAKLLETRSDVQDLLQHHRALVDSGHMPKLPSDVLLEHWMQVYMTQLEAMADQDNELAAPYEALVKEIEHYKDMERSAVAILDMVRQESKKQGGLLQWLWLKFEREHTMATIKVFGHYLAEMLVEGDKRYNDGTPMAPEENPALDAPPKWNDEDDSEGAPSGDADDNEHAEATAAATKNPDHPEHIAKNIAQRVEAKAKSLAEKAETEARHLKQGVMQKLHEVKDKIHKVEANSVMKYDAANVNALADKLIHASSAAKDNEQASSTSGDNEEDGE